MPRILAWCNAPGWCLKQISLRKALKTYKVLNKNVIYWCLHQKGKEPGVGTLATLSGGLMGKIHHIICASSAWVEFFWQEAIPCTISTGSKCSHEIMLPPTKVSTGTGSGEFLVQVGAVCRLLDVTSVCSGLCWPNLKILSSFYMGNCWSKVL